MPSRFTSGVTTEKPWSDSMKNLRLASVLAFLMVTVLSAVAGAQSVEPLLFAAAQRSRPTEDPPLRLAAQKVLTPFAELDKAIVEEGQLLAQINRWNEEGRVPTKNGFSRSLGKRRPVSFRPGASAWAAAAAAPHAGGWAAKSATGDLVWGASVRVEGSYRLRLRLTQVQLPPAARLWIYSGSGESGETVGPFGVEAMVATGAGKGGELWTPSVAGPVARIEVAVPISALKAGDPAPGFVLDEVMEIVKLRPDWRVEDGSVAQSELGECVIDASCSNSIPLNSATLALVQRSVAALQFVSNGVSFLCTGSLMADIAQSATPFLWTANHCISSPGEAASLEAFWDYTSLGCNGPDPDLGGLERSFSSTLLSTGAASDFTLLQLNGIPNGRVFLGWSADPALVSAGTQVHRVSHPQGQAQRYSRSTISSSVLACFSAPQPQFLYHTTNLGGTFGGSSGAALLLPTGQLVGQLTGGCPQNAGTDPFDGCDYDNAEVDGSFAASFSSVAQFIAGAPSGPCINTDTDLCLNKDRFKVEVDWRTPAGATGEGQVVPFRSDNSGLYYFFNPSNWEMLIKVLDGCSLNGRYWVFFAATTNVEFTVKVTDSQSGVVKQYFNPLGQSADAVTDTAAFATCP